MGMHAMMAHQAFERGAVDMPVMLAQQARCLFFQLEFAHDVARHFDMQMREDFRICIMQRVVEVENPDLA